MTAVYLVLGGSLGTLARYYVADRVGEWSNSGAFGIFVVNIAGSFIIGLFLGLGEERHVWSFETRVLVATGFLGAFTTFSTLMWQSYQLYDIRDATAATLNLVGSLVVGMLAVYLGALTSRVGA
jgi:CrcB protein